VYVINSGSTKDTFMQNCLRELCYIEAIYISLRLKLSILLGGKICLQIIYLDGIYITDIKIVLFLELNFRITKKFKFLILAIIF
jgi:hypothetical protein